MMEQIEATIKEMLRDEFGMPPNVRGRIYTPAPGTGMFLLRLVPGPSQGNKVVILLIRWSDLYIMAIYVEAVWYHYNDFDREMLPTQSQLSYNRIIKLPLSSSYGSIGGFCIKVGKPAFTHCILTLGKIGELYGSQQGLKVLRSRPLSLPTITISEAIRFGLWRNWVITHMDKEVDTEVTVEHNSLFNHWSDISIAVAKNKSWGGRGVSDLVRIVRVLMRNSYIKPDTAKGEGSASRSKKK